MFLPETSDSDFHTWPSSSRSADYIPSTDDINQALAQLTSRSWSHEVEDEPVTPCNDSTYSYVSAVIQQLQTNSSTASSPTSSTFTSPRSSSTRSSFGRGSARAKRSLSQSPSDCSLDINTIIRQSPTSLSAYLSSSRSSLVSGSGSYGHLSARNSLQNSPNSDQGPRRFSFTASGVVSPDLALQAIQELEQASYRGDELVDANLAVIEQHPIREKPSYLDHQFVPPAPPPSVSNQQSPSQASTQMPPLQHCSSMERLLRSQVSFSNFCFHCS